MGARVIVCEINTTRALEAVMDGLQVLPMREAAALGDLFVTATGTAGVIGAEHMAETNEANMPVPEMKLENVPVPVADVDRAKAFYEQVGFKLDVDTRPTEMMRVLHFTWPGSACSMVFGTGMGEITAMTPGSVKGLHLVVADIPTARSALVNRGIEVGEITDSLCKPTSGRFFRQWAVRRGHLTLQ